MTTHNIPSLPGPDDIHREVLPNGITILTRSNFNSPSVVVSGYFGAGAKIFQKADDARVTLASRLLLAPYGLGAKINAWAWTRRLPARVETRAGA